MAEFTERAVRDMEHQVGMDAHTIRQWASDATQGDRHCIVGFGLERSEMALELLEMLRRLDESSMLLPATLSADLEDLIDRYKDVKTEEV